MNTTKSLALAALVAIGTTSCITYEDVEVKKVDNFNVEGIFKKDEETKVTMDVDVYNPNTYGITIRKAELNLYVGGKDLGPVTLDRPVKFKKKSETTQTLVIKPKSKKMLGGVLSGGLDALLSGGMVTVRVKGRIKGRAFGIGKWFDVDEKTEVNLKDKIKLFGGLIKIPDIFKRDT